MVAAEAEEIGRGDLDRVREHRPSHHQRLRHGLRVNAALGVAALGVAKKGVLLGRFDALDQ